MNWHDVPLEGKGIRQLCGTVLIMEAVVIGLAILPAIVLEHANRGLAGGIGGALAICALLIGGAFYFLAGFTVLMLASQSHTLSPWTMGLPFVIGQSLMAAILYFASGADDAED